MQSFATNRLNVLPPSRRRRARGDVLTIGQRRRRISQPRAPCCVAQHPIADGYIPHHLDRFIARHRHDGSGELAGRVKERERESARARAHIAGTEREVQTAVRSELPSKRKPLSARAGRDKSFHYGLRYSLFTRRPIILTTAAD